MSIFEAIAAGDKDALRGELDRDPESAGVRNAEGLSPVLYALYNGKAELVGPILDANPALDVFDAAAVGPTNQALPPPGRPMVSPRSTSPPSSGRRTRRSSCSSAELRRTSSHATQPSS